MGGTVKDWTWDGGYGFKLLVTANLRDFQDYLSRSRKYSHLHNCNICFMVNLCTDDKLTRVLWNINPWDNIPVHVVYDIQKGSAYICYRDVLYTWRMSFIHQF